MNWCPGEQVSINSIDQKGSCHHQDRFEALARAISDDGAVLCEPSKRNSAVQST